MSTNAKSPSTPDTDESRTLTDFFSASQQILLVANRSRPTVEFLIDLSNTLLPFFKCQSLELWLKDKVTCTRWEATLRPRRFSRLEDVPHETVDALINEGVVWTNNARKEKLKGIRGEERDSPVDMRCHRHGYRIHSRAGDNFDDPRSARLGQVLGYKDSRMVRADVDNDPRAGSVSCFGASAGLLQLLEDEEIEEEG